MRIFKSNPVLTIVNSYLVDSPEPTTISYLWNFGSLLGLCLVAQIITGILLAMHFVGSADLAFNSVEHIMRDVNDGWLMRYTHANMASFFFICVYAHISRGLYYGSYKSPRIGVWVIGTIIFFLMMATAFLGYYYSPKWFIYNNFEFDLWGRSELLVPFGWGVFYLFNTLLILSLVSFLLEVLIIFRNEFEKEYVMGQIKFKKLNIKFYNYLRPVAIGRNTGINNLARVPRARWARINLFCSVKSSMIPNSYKLSLMEYSTCRSKSDNRISSNILEEIINELGLIPVYLFENLNLETTKQQILNDTKGLSGIYMIVNKITKDYYIGSASTNRLYARFSNHLIYYRGSKIVKSAVKKYNLENFAFLVLELYPNIVTKENNKELIDLEDKYLKLFLPNYNILTEAGSSFGYKHTEMDRQKMKDNYSDARRGMIGSLNRGKKIPQETIEKMREIALNRPPMKEETRKKCIRHTRPVTLYNLNGTVYGKYTTIIEAAKAINCGEKTIRRALKTDKKLVKRQWIVKDSSPF
jgi:group I intron endonuclease